RGQRDPAEEGRDAAEEGELEPLEGEAPAERDRDRNDPREADPGPAPRALEIAAVIRGEPADQHGASDSDPELLPGRDAERTRDAALRRGTCCVEDAHPLRSVPDPSVRLDARDGGEAWGEERRPGPR